MYEKPDKMHMPDMEKINRIIIQIIRGVRRGGGCLLSHFR